MFAHVKVAASAVTVPVPKPVGIAQVVADDKVFDAAIRLNEFLEVFLLKFDGEDVRKLKKAVGLDQ